jgi:hypothetical protein
MPIKIFEAISYGLPIFTTDGTETARFVGREGIGWLVSTPAQASNLLLNLKANPHLIAQKRCHVKQIRQRHTWQARAQTVVDALTGPEAA